MELLCLHVPVRASLCVCVRTKSSAMATGLEQKKSGGRRSAEALHARVLSL